jgi:F0F1-type ATP synthase epsilon subunit
MIFLDINDWQLTLRKAHQPAKHYTGAAANTPNGLVFDDDALARSRSHPQQFSNRYLSTIAADPVAGDLGVAKNHADLIYRQLLQNDLPSDDDLVLAVQGQISNTQLGLLLGICSEAKLQVRGFIDLGLGQSLNIDARDTYHVLDVEQHRMTLTEIQIDGVMRQQQRTTSMDGVGTANIIEGWMNIIADEFVQKTRFDPLHSGETEQQLFDQVYTWLAEPEMTDHVVSVSNGEASREVEISKSRLLEKLTQRLEGVDLSSVAHLVLTPRAASIPALKQQLETRVSLCSVIDEADILPNYELLAEALSAKQVKRISQAPGRQAAPLASNQNALAEQITATHWLLHNTAYPLSHPKVAPAGNGPAPVETGTQVTADGQTYTAIRVE